ncbi:MAG: tetratricopeptide repeat protein [Bdellovibrionota bacterium]
MKSLPQKLRIFRATLLALCLATTSLGARADDATTCAQVLRNVERVRDKGVLLGCMDFYFSNQDLDPQPGSFNAVVRLGYRVLELDPSEVETYGNVSWLLWSKWVSWKEDPARMPDGQNKLAEAVALLDRGETFNSQSVEYFIEAANTLWPVAEYHDASLYARVIRWYRSANEGLATSDPRKIRTLLNLGHIHRKLGLKPDARRYYEAVLEIDPDNAVALRSLKSLDPS